jgi:hypothetical protein
MRRTLLAIGLLVALTACGTTVPVAQQGASLGSELGGPGAVGVVPSAAPGAISPGSAAAPTAGPPRVGGAAVTAQPGTSSSGSAPIATSNPARKGAPIEVGFFVTKDLGPATKALGVDGLATGDGKRQAQATVALVNARGGIAGHPIIPVIFEYDVNNGATQFQAACSTWFDDHKVRAVVSILVLPTLRACAAKRGVPFVSSGNRTTTDATIRQYPLTALPPQMSLERMIPAWIASLKQQGYFAAGSKIGLVFNDEPDYAGVPAMVDRELRAIGSQLLDKQPMPSTDDVSRVSAATSAGQNAALKFSSQGIDRVLAVDKSGQALSYFGIAAANQAYYPTYGLSSLELPSLLRTILSARQLQGARGIGWSPGVDLPSSKQPVLSANGTACLKAMTNSGEDMTSSGTRFSALSTCEGLLLLQTAWTDPSLSGASFLSGLRALGPRFPPALTFAADFTARLDGAASFRNLAFDAGCDCFAYRGALRAAP